MIRSAKALLLAASIVLLPSCASPIPIGIALTDIQLPLSVSEASGASKVGTASCQSVLGLMATGDCSIATAKANGGITVVSHMDWKVNNILGMIGNYTLTVYGE